MKSLVILKITGDFSFHYNTYNYSGYCFFGSFSTITSKAHPLRFG